MSHPFPWKLAGSVYVMSYGLVISFWGSYFWDDWGIYFSRTNIEIADQFRRAGHPPYRSWIESIVLGNHPEMFRFGTLICYFACGWFIFKILQTLKFLKYDQTVFITLIFLVLPINSARVAMIDFSYGYSLTLFYFGWYLGATRRSGLSYIAAVILMLLSFGTTASLIVFFVVPCCHWLFMQITEAETNRRLSIVLFTLVISIAPIYWFLDRRFNAPLGDNLQMYSLQKSGVFRSLILLLVASLICFWYAKAESSDRIDGNRYLLITLGTILVIIGAAPYIVAGHLVDVSEWMLNFVPRASDWSSRHQLLLGLGLAVIIVGILGELNSRFKRQLVFAIIGICVLLNATFMHAYFLDSLKQDQFIDAIRQDTELSLSKVIMIDDQAERFNARGRFVRYYEWDAMFGSAYGNDSKHTISGLSYVDCASDLIPDTLLTITATNGRLKATLLRDIGINIGVTKIDPCP
jgi:hypothetical protein